MKKYYEQEIDQIKKDSKKKDFDPEFLSVELLEIIKNILKC